MNRVWIISVSLLLAPATIQGQTPVFTPANDDASVHYTHTLNGNFRSNRIYGAGAAAADYDNDGDIDLFIPQAFEYPNELYRNNGDGTFTEIASAAGVDSLKEARAALWIDFDNDGWLDLFVANDPDAPAGQVVADPATTRNLLYRNLGDGTFQEVSEQVGIDQMPNPEVDQTTGGLAAGDINNDGLLDIYVSCWNNQNALFIGSNGVFREISVQAGVAEPGFSWTPMFFDVNRDGWIDLLLNMDYGPNRLFINQQDNTFVDMAATLGFDSAFNEMGMGIADHDNDGDFDVLATNITAPYPSAGGNLQKWTVLLDCMTTNGAVQFNEIARVAGVAETAWGWGCTWADCNNDGWIDLGVTNGYIWSLYQSDASRFFINSHEGFQEVSDPSGFNHTHQGRGLIAFDYDQDGDLDLYETNYNTNGTLFRNDTSETGNWLAIDLIATTPGNRFAVGAEITVTAAGLTQQRLVTAGSSFLSQEPSRAFFGLGEAALAESVQIRWHDGTIQVLANIHANRVVKIKQGLGALPDSNLDGDIDLEDIAQFQRCFAGPSIDYPVGDPCLIGDFDADADVDQVDYAQFTAFVDGPIH